MRIKAILTSKEVANFLISKQFLPNTTISSKELRLFGGIYMLTTHVHVDSTARTPSLWMTDHWARWDLFHSTLEKFETSFYTFKSHQMFSLHTTLEKFENATVTSRVGLMTCCDRHVIVFESSVLGREFLWIVVRGRFSVESSKAALSNFVLCRGIALSKCLFPPSSVNGS